MEKTMEKIVALAKARGFVYPGSEIYGGLANTWDYGNLGVELKNNVKKAWWQKFVQESPYNVGVDCAILMNPQTWVASGHLGGFSDPLMDCKECHERFRADKLIEDWADENKFDLGGSVDGFVQQMNTRAQELGCTNTVFTNPTGLPDDNQHTTAHDMALIMQAAIQNESFRTIAAATSYTIPATNKAAARNLTSKFTMTDTGSTGFYEGCIGGKEGYTEASGSTLVCAAQRNGMTLISVVLKGASGQTAPDAASILNYGFDQFVTLSLGDSDFSIISGGDVVVPAGTGADSLTTEDSQNGDQIDRTYLFNGTSVGSAVLEVVQSDDTASVQEGQQHMQAAKDYSDNHTEIPYFVIAGVFLLLLILLIWRIVKIVKS